MALRDVHCGPLLRPRKPDHDPEPYRHCDTDQPSAQATRANCLVTTARLSGRQAPARGAMAGAMLADCRVRTVESVDHGVIITALKAFNVASYPARRVVDLSPCRRALAYFRENRLTMAMCACRIRQGSVPEASPSPLLITLVDSLTVAQGGRLNFACCEDMSVIQGTEKEREERCNGLALPHGARHGSLRPDTTRTCEQACVSRRRRSAPYRHRLRAAFHVSQRMRARHRGTTPSWHRRKWQLKAANPSVGNAALKQTPGRRHVSTARTRRHA